MTEQIRQKLLSVFTVAFLAIVAALPVTVSAAESSDDGITITFTPDQEEYARDDAMHLEIKATNLNDFEVNNLGLEIRIPDKYELDPASERALETESLEPGETISLPVTLVSISREQDTPPDKEDPKKPENPDEPKTPDEGDKPADPSENPQDKGNENEGKVSIDPKNKENKEQKNAPGTNTAASTGLIVFGMAGALTAGLFLIVKTKNAKKYFAIILAGSLSATALGTTRIYANENVRIVRQIRETVLVDGSPVDLEAEVSYDPLSIEEGISTIIFDLNNGQLEPYDWQEIQNGSYVTEPEQPENGGYEFSGWFTEPEGLHKFDFRTPVWRDLTLYAKWGTSAEPIEGIQEPSEVECIISDLWYENGLVTAELSTNQRAALVFEFLDPETENVFSVVGTVTPDYAEMEIVSAEVLDEIPEYFILRACLYDENENQLCNPYITIDYTKEHKIFEEQTIYDFEDRLVINFDEEAQNNFAVMVEDVILPFQDENTNILYVEQNEDTDDVVNYGTETGFTFLNPDDQVRNLKDGDRVLAADYLGNFSTFIVDGEPEWYSEDEIHFVSKPYDISDFYDVMKLDTSDISPDDETVVVGEEDREYPGEQVSTYGIDVGQFEISADGSANFKISATRKLTESVKFSVNGNAKIKGTVKIERDVILFGEDYIKNEVKKQLTTSFKPKLEWKEDNEEESEGTDLTSIPLPWIEIPLPVPSATWFTKSELNIGIAIKASVSGEIQTDTVSGFKYDSTNGETKLKKEETKAKFDGEGEFTVKVGPKLSTGIKICGETLKGELSLGCGVQLKGELYSSRLHHTTENEESKHTCDLCVSMTASGYMEAGVGVTLKVAAWSWNVGFDIAIAEVKITFSGYDSIYFAVLPGEDNVFQTFDERFGLGECPNIAYRVDVIIRDRSGTERENIPVHFRNDKKETQIELNSPAKAYLHNGKYVVSAAIDGTAVNKMISVNSGTRSLELNPDSVNGKIMGQVVNMTDNMQLPMAKITVKDKGTVVASTQSGEGGVFEVTVPDGTFMVTVSLPGYYPFIQYVTVRNGENNRLAVSLMTQRGLDDGGASGTLFDAVTNNVVPNAKIKIYEGWDNAGYTTPVKELKADSNGRFEVKLRRVLGVVNLGLKPGNYTVGAFKSGYRDTYFNITVRPSSLNDNQNGVMNPIQDSEKYRIVLTWGSTPNDLDSHYIGKLANDRVDHVYYQNKYGNSAVLDVDDTSSYGPETITINDEDLIEDGFTYCVHDFSNRGSQDSQSLSLSGATVKVYVPGEELPVIFNIPSGKKGTLWRVFEMDSSGKIKTINELEFASDPGSIR